MLTLLLVVSGCGFEGVQSLPLPGGADLGESPREVRIEFSDALDLVPQSLCKVNDVTVGKVSAVELSDGWRAEVTCEVRGDVALPDRTSAAISQTGLLGEKYIKLQPAGKEVSPPRYRRAVPPRPPRSSRSCPPPHSSSTAAASNRSPRSTPSSARSSTAAPASSRTSCTASTPSPPASTAPRPT